MSDREETYMLVAVMMFFTIVVMWCEHHFQSDAQIFQLFASVITGASGALFMKLKGSQGHPPPSEKPDPPQEPKP